jgi:3-hydroxy-9,10-secoandrosta-1,3,5(10)-triene-9,17-dione monooxygenase
MNDYDPIAATHAILSKLEETSANSELLRRVDDAAVAAMRDAGLARLLAPKQFGGHELPLSMHIRTGIIAAGGCSAAAWVHMVWGAHTFVLGRFSKACQEEVFGASPDVLLPGTLAPQGSVEAMAGGWRLNGRWQFASGVDHGPWLLLGAAGEKDGSGRRAAPRHVVVPKSDMVVDDTWHTLGMRGTGSSDIVAHDVFVPEYRSMPTIPLFMGTFEGDAGALYRLPVMGGLASMLAGVVLGMAEAAMRPAGDQIVDQDVVAMVAARLTMRLVNTLPVFDGDTVATTRKWRNIMATARKSGLSPMASRYAENAYELCRYFSDRVVRGDMRGCMQGQHDKLIKSLNSKYWKAIRTGS